jgi:ribosomal protein L18E
MHLYLKKTAANHNTVSIYKVLIGRLCNPANHNTVSIYKDLIRRLCNPANHNTVSIYKVLIGRFCNKSIFIVPNTMMVVRPCQKLRHMRKIVNIYE